MFNVCPGCGQYSEEKSVDIDGPFAVCPHCDHRHPFLRLPLFLITGASGAGKTTIGLHLQRELNECVVMESDILWRTEFTALNDNYRTYRNLWLRVAKNINQAGRPVVLLGSAIPEQFEGCSERRYFSTLNYLAVVCADDVLVKRLRERPKWRQSRDEDFVERMVAFNQWCRETSLMHPTMSLLDTTELSVPEAVAETAAWVRRGLTT